MRTNYRRIKVAAKNVDTREHDIADSDDYYQYHGGMVATVRALTGSDPRAYVGDSTTPDAVRTRTLQEETNRVFRARVVNPRWIGAMQRHGYKGAFELAATVDYLFGFDATTGVVHDWMYDRLAAEYVLDETNQEFMRKSNPWALRGIVEKLHEAVDRGLWENPDAGRARSHAAGLPRARGRHRGPMSEPHDPRRGGRHGAAARHPRGRQRRCARRRTSSRPARVPTTPCSRYAASCARGTVSRWSRSRIPLATGTSRPTTPGRCATGTPPVRRRGVPRSRRRNGDPAFLVWGDPSLYDSTIRVVDTVAAQIDARVEVVAGISAPQLLAARHGIVLHPVGAPVHVTTQRRQAEAIASGQRNLVVMLTSRVDLGGLEDWSLWWGANLGTPSERLVSGRAGDVCRRGCGGARGGPVRGRLGDGPLPAQARLRWPRCWSPAPPPTPASPS